jgi:hypothetical protein
VTQFSQSAPVSGAPVSFDPIVSATNAGAAPVPVGPRAGFGSGDGVQPNWWAGSAPGGSAGTSAASGPATGFLGFINGLIASLQGAAGSFTGASSTGGSTCRTPQPVQRVANASFGSNGDPHLSESGTIRTASGTTQSVNTTFNDMSAQSDLLSSRDFAGGYRVSTTVTTPNAQGVTLNQSVTVHADGGNDAVTLNANGTATVVDGGQTVKLARGCSLTLAGGETVTANTNGSLVVAATNAYGGSIATTLQTNGNGGVNTTTTVHNAVVSGSIVAQADAS